MVKNTLILVGPGGIGKSPLDHIFKRDIIRIDPYRLRSKGPRDSYDIFYTNPKLKNELYSVFKTLNISFSSLSPTVDWFPQARILFFKVRNDWQFLVLEGLNGDIAKAELYAPIVPMVMSQPQINPFFGNLEAIVLHPGKKNLNKMRNWNELEEETKNNCRLRGDDSRSISKRGKSIKEEGPFWRMMIEQGATEYENWQFPEYKYKLECVDRYSLILHQIDMLIEAKKVLLAKNSQLEIFFRSDDEIRIISEPIMK